jgi:hypothetical protein
MGSSTQDEPPRHPPFHAPAKPAHAITPYRLEGTSRVNQSLVFYNPLKNRKNNGCKTLMPHQSFPNIIPMGGEHTQGGYIFILNFTCYKLEIHELFIVVRTLSVWWEVTKRPTFERLHLWWN